MPGDVALHIPPSGTTTTVSRRKSQQSCYNTVQYVGCTEFDHTLNITHEVMTGKSFPYYWPFVQGICHSPMDSLTKGQLNRFLMFSLLSAWKNALQTVELREIWDTRKSMWYHYNDFFATCTIYRYYQNITLILWCRIVWHQKSGSLHII